MKLNEKILLSLIPLISLIFCILIYLDNKNRETIKIKGIVYYCEKDYSYYYEDLPPEVVLIPFFNGTPLQYLPQVRQESLKQYLNYNICERVKKENK